MEYISVTAFAQKHGLPERTVRNWCASGKIPGAFLTGKTWSLPADSELPVRGAGKKKPSPLLKRLREEKEGKISGGIYLIIQASEGQSNGVTQGYAKATQIKAVEEPSGEAIDIKADYEAAKGVLGSGTPKDALKISRVPFSCKILTALVSKETSKPLLTQRLRDFLN